MTVHDLIGIPFPHKAPLFASDPTVLDRLKRVEDLIEIHNEFTSLEDQIGSAQKIITCDREKLFDVAGFHLLLVQAITVGCVVTYGKNFKSSARLKLEARKIFRGTGLLIFHEFLMGLRDKWFAHQEYVGDKHHLFIFQDPLNRRIICNPHGAHHHVMIGDGLDWDDFLLCVQRTIKFTSDNISRACSRLEQSLSVDQIDFINSLERSYAMNEYWDQQPKNRRDPFESR